MSQSAPSLKSAVIESRDPAALSLHIILKRQPGEWSDDDPRFHALSDDIAARGIDHPILITPDNKIADGRHRWRVAKKRQLPAVPVRVIPESEVHTVIVQSLLQRRHYTAGQRAYLLAPSLDKAFEEALQRKLSGKSCLPSELSSEGQNSLEKWANSIGVSVKYLREARHIHEAFADDTKHKINVQTPGKKSTKPQLLTLREYFEPQILDPHDPVGLGAIKAGIASIVDAAKKGKPHGGGKPENTSRQLDLFTKVVEDQLNRWEYWQKFDDETRQQHFKTVRAKAAELAAEDHGPDQLEAMAEYHSKLASEYRRAAKEAKAGLEK